MSTTKLSKTTTKFTYYLNSFEIDVIKAKVDDKNLRENLMMLEKWLFSTETEIYDKNSDDMFGANI